MLSTELGHRLRCPSPKPVNGLNHEATCLPWTMEMDADGQMKKQWLAWSWSLTLPPQGPVGGIIYALNGEHMGTRVDVTTDGETEASKKGHARVTQPVSKVAQNRHPLFQPSTRRPPSSNTLPCHPAPGPGYSRLQDAGGAKHKTPCSSQLWLVLGSICCAL